MKSNNSLQLNPDWVATHLHSIGSLRDGIMRPIDIVKWHVDNKKKFVAITDHGSMSEWISLYTECKANKVKPIFGIEGYILFDRDKYLESKEGKPEHIVLLALNNVGFKNIIKIHNDSWEHFYKKPIMSYDTLFKHSEGIVASTACMGGTLSRRLIAKDIAGADEFIELMKKNLPDRFFIELMTIDMAEQDELNRQLIQMAKKHEVPLLVGNDPHYMTEEDKDAHQLSLLIQSNKTVKDLANGQAWKFSAQDLWMKTEKDLYNTWKVRYANDSIFTEDVFIKATWNSNLITDKIENIYLEHPPRLPKYPHGKKALEDMATEGFGEKLQLKLIPEDKIDLYMERVKYELKVIDDLELVDYFLLIKEIHEFCKENNIATGPGRGSVSASLVTYLMGITKLDPIKHEFIFERFLNPARKTRLKIF
jgi:DNA polymerase-3 subunit alpha